MDDLLRRAFPEDAEARLVLDLRADGDVVIEHVAEAEGKPVGHILLSRLKVDQPGVRALALAPLAVEPASQGEHVGSALVVEACTAAEADGHHLVVVLGDVGWYKRLGFTHLAASLFTCEYAGPNLMARDLRHPPSPPERLKLTYPAAFARLG